jgi:hypothetical protein
MNTTALPIRPLARVTAGEHPLNNALHLGLLFFLWFLPLALFVLMASTWDLPHITWSSWDNLRENVVPYVGGFAVLATVLTVAVGRSASAGWTMTVHGVAIMLLYVFTKLH